MEAQQQQQDATLADVRLKMGFVTNLSKDFLSLFNSFKERLAPMNGVSSFLCSFLYIKIQE